MTVTDLTFTAGTVDEGLRYWDLRGPAGLIRFKTADALGIRTASVYLHAAVAPGGGELEDCVVCGRCWRDTMSGQHARDLRADWEGAACDDAVIRTQLERWYAENLAVWAAEHAEPANQGEPIPADRLAMVLAELAPDLPYIPLATLAAALAEAGYQVIRTTTVDGSGEPE